MQGLDGGGGFRCRRTATRRRRSVVLPRRGMAILHEMAEVLASDRAATVRVDHPEERVEMVVRRVGQA